MNFDPEKIQMKFKILTDKKLKAIVALDFGDYVIRGFRIQESKFPNEALNGELIWITPPTYLGGGRHHPIFFLKDKSLWEKVMLKMWTEYQKQNSEQHRKMYGINEDEWANISSP